MNLHKQFRHRAFAELLAAHTTHDYAACSTYMRNNLGAFCTLDKHGEWHSMYSIAELMDFAVSDWLEKQS